LIVLHSDSRKIEEVARTFLSQNYSVIKIEKSKLVGQTWIVEVLVSAFDTKTIKKIKIDDNDGHILEVK
jgi:hypothetical protein